MTLQDSFHRAVESDLGSGTYCKGLQALKAEDRQRITLSHPRQCHGSADIDKAMARAHPNAARWDYVVAYEETQLAVCRGNESVGTEIRRGARCYRQH